MEASQLGSGASDGRCSLPTPGFPTEYLNSHPLFTRVQPASSSLLLLCSLLTLPNLSLFSFFTLVQNKRLGELRTRAIEGGVFVCVCLYVLLVLTDAFLGLCL